MCHPGSLPLVTERKPSTQRMTEVSTDQLETPWTVARKKTKAAGSGPGGTRSRIARSIQKRRHRRVRPSAGQGSKRKGPEVSFDEVWNIIPSPVRRA